MPRWLVTVVVVGTLAGMAGCGCQAGLVPVSGQVTLEGRPVRDMVITFEPLGDTVGSGSIGGTDGAGKFTLTDVRGQPGAYVGEYLISFYPMGKGPSGDPADVVSASVSRVPAICIDPNLPSKTA